MGCLNWELGIIEINEPFLFSKTSLRRKAELLSNCGLRSPLGSQNSEVTFTRYLFLPLLQLHHQAVVFPSSYRAKAGTKWGETVVWPLPAVHAPANKPLPMFLYKGVEASSWEGGVQQAQRVDKRKWQEEIWAKCVLYVRENVTLGPQDGPVGKDARYSSLTTWVWDK